MSKNKYKNLDEETLNKLRVMEYSQLKKLNKHFSKTTAETNFLTKFGSIMMLLLSIPALVFSFYLFATAIITLVESSYFMINSSEPFFVLNSGDAFISTWFIPQWNSIVNELGSATGASSVMYISWAGATIGEELQFLLISIIIAIPFLFWTLMIISAYTKSFQILIGKANNKWYAIWKNIFVMGITIILSSLFLFGFSSTQSWATEGKWSEVKPYLNSSYYYLLIMFVLGILPLIFGKYKLRATLSY